jgi:hypothetical protein
MKFNLSVTNVELSKNVFSSYNDAMKKVGENLND